MLSEIVIAIIGVVLFFSVLLYLILRGSPSYELADRTGLSRTMALLVTIGFVAAIWASFALWTGTSKPWSSCARFDAICAQARNSISIDIKAVGFCGLAQAALSGKRNEQTCSAAVEKYEELMRGE